MDCFTQSEGYWSSLCISNLDQYVINLALTSIGDRNVTFRFMEPACMMKMLRVGVICLEVKLQGSVKLSEDPCSPSHLYVLPSILM